MSAPRAPVGLRLAPHAVLAALILGLLAALAGDGGPAGERLGLAAATAAGIAFAAALHRRRAALAALALAVVALAAGWTWGGARLRQTAPPALHLPASARGTVEIDAPPAPDPRGGWRARVVADRLSVAGVAVPRGARLLADLPAGRAPPPLGARLAVRARASDAAGPDAPGWWRAYLARQGIAGRLRVSAATREGQRGGLAGLLDGWRRWAGENAGAGLSGDRAALVRGMALGGGTGLSEESAQAFRDAGLWHLLAVSGQNVAVVALAVLAALRAVGVGRRAAVAAGVAVLVAYCLACQGGPSVARAGVVGGLGALAELRSGERQRWYLLLAGLAGILAVQPRAIGDPGLQLSFAAVVGLFVIAPPLGRWARGWLPARVADLAGLAAGASLATAPVVVWHFGRLSLAGLALNIVAVPVAGPVVVVALAGLAAGALVPAAGVALAWAAGWGAASLLALARLASSLPGAAVDLPPAAALPLALAAAAVPIAARWLGRVPDPGPRPRRARGPAAAALIAGCGIVALVVPWPGGGGSAPWPASAALTALDVGQGDALLLRAPDGAAVLVDAGPSGDPAPVLGALRREGVRRLAAVVVTHAQADHAGGAAAVLGRYPVRVLVHPPFPRETPLAAALGRAARRRGVPVREVTAGAALRAGGWRLRVLWPERRPAASADPNQGALVALATAAGFDVLLTADAESPVLGALPLHAVDVLKVAHHGSDDPGLPSLLRRVRPGAAVISVGPNRYGHPAPSTVAALRAAGVPVWRTDRQGDVTLTGRGG